MRSAIRSKIGLRTALLATGLALIGHVADAAAYRAHHHVALSACAGSDGSDGCGTQPVGAQIQFPAFASGGEGNTSGQTYTVVLNYERSFIEFASGPTVAEVLALDAVSHVPTGCAVTDPSNNSNPATYDITKYYYMDCGTGSPVTIQGLTFKAINGHGYGAFNFHSSQTGALTIRDNWFKEDDNCNATTQTGGNFINVQVGATAPLTIQNNSFDGNDSVCRFIEGEGGLNLQGTGSKTIERNYIGHLTGRALSLRGDSSTTDVVQYNLISGFNTVPWQGHAETGLHSNTGGPGGSAYNSLTYRYNVFNASQDMAANGTVILFLTDGFPGTDFTTLTIDHNFFHTNTTGGASATLTSSLTFYVDTDPATGFHNRGHVVTISGGTVRSGTQLGASGLNANVMKILSGAGGAGTVFTLACGEPANSFNCPGGPLTLARPNFPVGADVPTADLGSIGSPVSGTWANHTMSVACIAAGSDNIAHLTVTNNQCDKTGALFGDYFHAYADARCANPPVFSGNKDPITGAAINGWTTEEAGSTCH